MVHAIPHERLYGWEGLLSSQKNECPPQMRKRGGERGGGKGRRGISSLKIIDETRYPFWYRLIGLESGSFLRGDYKITQRWAKVFLKALVERNSVMVVLFYIISIFQKYGQKHII